jgi:hypothetical protein
MNKAMGSYGFINNVLDMSVYLWYLFKANNILSQKRNATCEKYNLLQIFKHHFKYRNKHYITLKYGTLVVQTLKFIKMSQFITLNSIAFR